MPRARRESVTKQKERPLYRQKKESRRDVDAELDADESGCRCKRDVASRTKLRDEVDDEFLNEVRAVGNTGYEGGARNFEMTER